MVDVAAAGRALTVRPAAAAASAAVWPAAMLWAAAVAALAFAVPTIFQAGLLLAGLCLVGAPHGVLDIDLALWAAPRRGRLAWLSAALGVYLALIAVVGVGWLVAPAATLVAFLAAAAFHFGSEDADAGEATAPVFERALLALGRGAAVIATPILFHPAAVAPIFAALAGASVGATRHAMAACAPALAVLLAGAGAVAFWRLAARGAWSKVVELAGVVALFACAPPLFAFAVYFCGVHALRHVAHVCAQAGVPRGPGRARWAAVRLAPVGLGFSLLLGAAALFAHRHGLGAADAAVVWSFRALAALTLPHLALTPLLERRLARRMAVGAHPG